MINFKEILALIVSIIFFVIAMYIAENISTIKPSGKMIFLFVITIIFSIIALIFSFIPFLLH